MYGVIRIAPLLPMRRSAPAGTSSLPLQPAAESVAQASVNSESSDAIPGEVPLAEMSVKGAVEMPIAIWAEAEPWIARHAARQRSVCMISLGVVRRSGRGGLEARRRRLRSGTDRVLESRRPGRVVG